MKTVFFACAAALLLTPFLTSPAGASQNTVIKLGHSAQVTHTTHAAAAVFADLVSKKSNGRITIEIYPARQLGGDVELIEQVMSGTLEMTSTGSSFLGPFTPALDVLQLPFLLTSYDAEEKAVSSPEFEALTKHFEPLNMKVMVVNELGMRQIANNKRPVEKIEDLAGLKLRAVPNPLIIDALKALGANPTPMAYGEVYTALQTKVIDGEEINYTSIDSEKHYEVLKYASEINLFPFPGVIMMNLDFFNKLTPEDQKILVEAGKEATPILFKALKEADARAVKVMQAQGIAINKVDKLDPFRAKVQPLYDAYAQKGPDFKAFIEMAKKLQ